MSSNLIKQPYEMVLDPTGGGGRAKPVANGKFYVGEIDKDPVANPRTDIAYKDESGQERPLTSPLTLNNSGAFVVSENDGTIIQPYMKQGIGHSVLITDRRGDSIYSDNHVGDPGNITEIVSSANLIPNSDFFTPGSVASAPDATPRSYSAGDELFAGFKAVGALSSVTYVSGKLNGAGQLYVDVYKAGKQKLSTTPYVASIASSDGIPVESGASFVDSGDYWRVTFDMIDTFSVKLEQGNVSTRHREDLSTVKVTFPQGSFETSGGELSPNHEITGKGKQITNITSQEGYSASPTSTARNRFKGFSLFNPKLDKTGIGLSTQDSSFATIDNVAVWGYAVGFQDNGIADSSSFSARSLITQLEANSNALGVKLWGSNANTYISPRIWNNDVGWNFNDAENITLIGSNTEANGLGLKARNSSITSVGGYWEAGAGNSNFDISPDCKINFSNELVNGDRGWVDQVNPNSSQWHFDAEDTASGHTNYSFMQNDYKNYIKDSFFEEGGKYWLLSGGATITTTTSGAETGKAIIVTPSVSGSNIIYRFTPEQGSKRMSVAIRYKKPSNSVTRFQSTNGSITRQVDKDLAGGWFTALLRVEIEDSSQVVDLKIFPDITTGTDTVTIDSIWCVKGWFAGLPTRYTQKIDVKDDIDELVNETTNVNANYNYTLPEIHNLKAARIRVSVTGTDSSANPASVKIAGLNASIVSTVSNLQFSQEFTVPGGNGIIQALTGGSSNNVNVIVELLELIYD